MATEIRIFDVEHGNCAVVWTPSGHLIMLDCGHNETHNWHPSTWLAAKGIRPELLIMSNLDEDHATDLPNIDRLCPPNVFITNPTLSPDLVVYKKTTAAGIGPGIAKAVEYLRAPANTAPPVNYGLEIQYFYHDYPVFDDFNNLSLVTFIFYAGLGIVFPGDIEERGWNLFLTQPNFRDSLARVNFFVASHHGRENGLAPAVFDYCRPNLFIFSDGSIRHRTQLMAGRYGAYARGVMFGNRRRDVLSTRSDGMVSISISSNGQASVNLGGN